MRKHLGFLLLATLIAISGFSQNTQPLNEGFEGSEFPPEGWTLARSSGYNNWSKNTTTSYVHSGGGSAKLGYSSSNNAYLITPVLMVQSGDSLVFYAMRQYGAYSTDMFTIEVSTTTPAVASFTAIDTVDLDSLNTSTMKRIAVSLENYAEQTIYIAFHYNPDGGCNVYVDDVSGVNMVVPACTKPANLVSTATTTSSITVNWTDTINTSWVVYYKNVSDSVDENGDPVGWDSLSTSTKPFEIPDLNSSTYYSVYVKADCGTDGMSDSLVAQTFMTACDVITVSEQIPYVASFADGLGCFTDSLISGTKHWEVWDDSTAKFSYSTDYSKGALVSPVFDITALSNPYLTFDYRNEDNYYGDWDTLLVYARADASSEWNLLYQTTGPDGSYSNYASVTPLPLPNSATMQFKFEAHDGDDAYGVYVQNIKIQNIACATPLVSVASITDNSATLNVNVEDFVVDYAPQGTETYDHATTNELTNLTPNTTYNVRVAAVCGSDVSDSVSLSFTTSCVAVELPYTNNFDAADTSIAVALSCWDYTTYSGYDYSSYSYKRYPYIDTTYAANGGSSLHLYAPSTYSTTPTQYAVLPYFDVTANPINTLQLSGKIRTSYSSVGIVVGVMSDVNNISTFDSIALVTPSSSSTWEAFDVALSSYTGTGTRVAFKVKGSADNVWLDSLVLGPIPSCVKPTNLAKVSSTTNSATLTFVPGHAGDVNFSVNYRAASSNSAWTTESVTLDENNQFTLNGLTASTTYEWTAQQDCGDGTLSDSSVLAIFTTACGDIEETQLPWSENFETTEEDSIPVCWTVLYGTVGVDEGSTYYSYGYNSANSLRFKRGTGTDTVAYALLPKFGVDFSDKQITYYSKSSTSYSNNTPGKLIFGYMTSATDTATFVPLYTDSTRSTWQLVTVSLASVPQDAYLAFAQKGATNDYYYWYVDTITVKDAPACLAPVLTSVTASQMTTTTATISWQDNNTENSAWKVYYRPVGDATATWQNADNDNGTSAELTGLTSGTKYEAYVVTDCSNEESDTTNHIIFRTLCEPQTVPYFNDFTNETVGEMPMCWQSLITPTSNTGLQNAVCSYDVKPLRMIIANNHDTSLVALPSFTNALNTLMVTFKAKAENTTSAGHLDVGYLTSASDASSFVTVQTIQPTNSSYNYYEVNFSSVEATNGTIALRQIGNPGTSWYYWLIDSVTVMEGYSCQRPTNVRVTNITNNSAVVEWTSDAESYNVKVVAQGSTDTTTLPATDTTATLTLQPNTTYTVFVIGTCSDNNQTNPSEVISFTTTCNPVTLPITENFDSYSSGSVADTVLSCWKVYTAEVEEDDYYYSYSSEEYPQISSTYAVSGNNSLKFDYYDSYDTYTYGDQIVVFPYFDATTNPVNTLQVSGQIRGSSTAKIVIGVMSDVDDVTTFDSVAVITPTSTWDAFEVVLNTYTGTGTRPAIKLLPSSSSYSEQTVYIDDLTLEVASDCARPSNLTVSNITDNQATLSWRGTASSYTVVYRTSTATDSTTVTATDTTTTLTNLSAATTYTAYVKVACSDGTEKQSSPITFTTTATPITIFPYSQDFEDPTNIPEFYLSNPSTNKWAIGSATGVAQAGASDTDPVHSLYISDDNGTTNHYTVSSTSYAYAVLTIQMPADSVELSFDYKVNGEVSTTGTVYDYLSVYVLDGTATIPTSSAPSGTPILNKANMVSSWTNFKDTIRANTGAVKQIVFYWYNDLSGGTQPPAALDNISIVSLGGDAPQPPVTAPTVTTLAASNIAQTTATLNGTVAAGSETITSRGFEWKQSTATTYTTVTATGNTMTYNLTSLTASTSYTYRAFAETASGRTYGSEVNFTTLAATPEPCTPTAETINASICDGQSYTLNGQTYATAGTYYDTLQNAAGCDSVITLNLTVNPTYNETVDTTITQGESVTLNGTTYTESGTYTATLTSVDGCDSTITLNLTVTDTATGALIDVEGGMVISLYPNPTSTNATLTIEGLTNPATIILTDQQGKEISRQTLQANAKQTTIDTYDLASGVYYVRIISGTTIKTQKLIKK